MLASDECYAELGLGRPVGRASRCPSVLDPRVTDGDRARHPVGVLAEQAVEPRRLPRRVPRRRSGRSSARLLTARKHLGLMLPAPVQAAMVAALGDDAHVAAQKERYRAGARCCKPARRSSGLPHRRERGRPVPVGDRGSRRVGEPRPARRSRHPRRPRSLLRRALPAARPAVAHGDRRAHRGGRSTPAGGIRSPREDSSIGCRVPLAVSAVGAAAH